VNLAREHDVCLIPYGGGTNVTDALQVPVEETRMVVSLDMRRMNAIEWIDAENQTACVQAGILGGRLQELLAEQGFTSGHEPDSMELSTLGGWVATNASGMKRNRYGNIEDIVENVTLVTPSGVVENLYWTPRQSAGVQTYKAAFGSEGNLGLVTKAVLRTQAARGEALRLNDLRRLGDRRRVHGGPEPDRRETGEYPAGRQRPVPAGPGAEAGAD
jgi:alkyldihydroxyacetonephosphate synthase